MPSGLESWRDKFRLIFVTSTSRNATATRHCDLQHLHPEPRRRRPNDDIQEFSSQFRVLGSTSAVDARDNTGTTGTGVPIYWLNGRH